MISIKAKIQTPHLNPFLKIPNPFLKIPNPNHDLNQCKNHDFGTEAPWVWRSRYRRNIFSCGFVFSVLPSSSKSISQNLKPKSRSQSEQKLLWVRVFSIKAKTIESRSQSKQKLLWVHGSCFLGWSVSVWWGSGGNLSLRDSSSTWIFLIHLSHAPHGNQVFETQFVKMKLSLIDSSYCFPK